MLSNENEIQKLEHDATYDVKKVSNFIDDGDGNLVRETASSFRIGNFDYITLTYVASGNGVGEIETITYKKGGASGTTLATLTITYNENNKISSITKS